MGKEQNVNVTLENLKYNVNVKTGRSLSKQREERIVARIMQKLGPASEKDEGYWHKVAKRLTEDQIETGLEIAAKKKPAGMPRVRYLGGIYANMMRQ